MMAGNNKGNEALALSVKDQQWMFSRLGIDFNALGRDTAAELFIQKMREMLAAPILIGEQKISYDSLAEEMVDAQVGLGFIDPEARESRDTQIENLTHGLIHLFLTDLSLEDMRQQDTLYD